MKVSKRKFDAIMEDDATMISPDYDECKNLKVRYHPQTRVVLQKVNFYTELFNTEDLYCSACSMYCSMVPLHLREKKSCEKYKSKPYLCKKLWKTPMKEVKKCDMHWKKKVDCWLLNNRLFIDNNDGTTLNDVLEDEELKKKDSVAVDIEDNFLVETVDETVVEAEAMVVEEDIVSIDTKENAKARIYILISEHV
jgi:hypothetical protein